MAGLVDLFSGRPGSRSGPASIFSSNASAFIFLALVVLVNTWSKAVDGVVPEPYLDEVFHVRQAQEYCAGHWRVWDPKITTPPGLYLVSSVLKYWRGCSTQSLRWLNGFVLYCFVRNEVNALLWHLKGRFQNKAGSNEGEKLLSVLNICLFPILFFFAALFYTDVLSVYFVLRAYRLFLESPVIVIAASDSNQLSFWRVIKACWKSAVTSKNLTLHCILSLLFRQTNIFWVAVFLGGLQVVRGLKRLRPSWYFSEAPPTYHRVISYSWRRMGVYDPPVEGASIEDYIKTGISLVVSTVANLEMIIPALIPFILTLVAFAAFVVWNGGVVLGDKSNHIATIHVPQMLYIWPYFTFFSLPLLWPYFVGLITPRKFRPSFISALYGKTSRPRILTAVAIIAVMLAIIHFNTIIHPFTLADNRHYMFYVFKLLRSHPLTRYLVAPAYLFCGWAVLSSLGGPSTPGSGPSSARTLVFSRTEGKKTTVESKSDAGNSASFILVFLLATTLSLITAPLVEPRYCIVPWILWRLHLPIESRSLEPPSEFKTEPPAAEQPKQSKQGKSPKKSVRFSPPHATDEAPEPSITPLVACLVVETLWFLCINAVTGFVFLYKGFTWPQEPGNIQRFMW